MITLSWYCYLDANHDFLPQVISCTGPPPPFLFDCSLLLLPPPPSPPPSPHHDFMKNVISCSPVYSNSRSNKGRGPNCLLLLLLLQYAEYSFAANHHSKFESASSKHLENNQSQKINESEGAGEGVVGGKGRIFFKGKGYVPYFD